MGSQVLKLLLTTRNFWLLSPSSSSELLPPSPAMAMEGMEAMEDTVEDTVEAMEATTTARGPLRLRLMPSPPPLLSPLLMPSPDMATTATALTDTVMLLLTPTDIIIMARGLLMLSPDTGTTAIMDTEATTEDTMATVATEDTTTARGLLMPSPDTGIMVMGTEATMEDTMATVATEDTTTVEKFQKFMLIQSD